MHYVTRRPSEPSADKAPTIIILHGYGADEQDLLSVASYFPKELQIISLQAPIQLDWGGYAWYNLEQTLQGLRADTTSRLQSESLLKQSLLEILNNQNADLNNIYLMGFSQGAAMCYGLIAENNFASQGIIIRALIALSGYIPREIISTLEAQTLGRLPVFISHGEYDELIPPIALDEAEKILTKAGATVTANIYEMGHAIDTDVIKDLQKWFATLAVLSV